MCDLTRDDIAPIIVGALHHFDGDRYDLCDYTIMPDHAHLILRPRQMDEGWYPISRIAASFKKWTARRINRILGRDGALWQDETFDHVIRDAAEFAKIAEYIRANPVAAGLTERSEDWPWTGTGQRPCKGWRGPDD